MCETAPVFQNTLSNYSNDLAIGDFISYTCRPGYEMAIPENETSVAFYCTKKAKWFGLSQIRCSSNKKTNQSKISTLLRYVRYL